MPESVSCVSPVEAPILRHWDRLSEAADQAVRALYPLGYAEQALERLNAAIIEAARLHHLPEERELQEQGISEISLAPRLRELLLQRDVLAEALADYRDRNAPTYSVPADPAR